jgi:Zn-dependent peptidase ImmA (M78 family)/DNA-binding XRE family transcriptional regulator
MGKALPVPFMLRWARESINYSIEDVAKKLKKSPQEIKDWETGKAHPTYKQLEKLANIYRRPVAVFYFPEPPLEEKPKEQFRTLPNFILETFSPAVVKLIRKAQVMRENLIELCDGRNPAPKNIIKDMRLELDSPLPNVAKKIRSYLGITIEEQTQWNNPVEAFAKWRETIEECGIFIFKDAFRNDLISGFCLYDEKFPLIYVNNSMSETRQIFTLFHEIAHLLFFTGGIDYINDTYLTDIEGKEKEIEIFCNAFAGEFLVPDYDFEKHLVEFRKDNIISYVPELAQHYLVSREVILRKLLDKNLISNNKYNQLVQEWNRDFKKERQQSSGGNYYNNIATYLGSKYLALTFEKYYRNQISISELGEYLGVKKIDGIHRLEIALGR